jgi:NAD(P)-dependent dehydrogenase (short-subunit alcohol dehydrogenase family)
MTDKLRDLVVLVTGATDGIGLATAQRLAGEGAGVLVHGRNPAKLAEVVAQLREGDARAEGFVADLASLEQTAALAREVAQRAPRLDVLINNAGVGAGSPTSGREVSSDGYELRLAVNYLAPFLLTHELLDYGRIRRAIINVASAGQAEIDFNDPMLTLGYDGWRAYGQSKLALVMLTFDLAEGFRRVGSNALHPGTFLDTKMVREAEVSPRGSPDDGAEAVVALLIETLESGVSGKYYEDGRPARPHQQAEDTAARRRLRILSEELTRGFSRAGQAQFGQPGVAPALDRG